MVGAAFDVDPVASEVIVLINRQATIVDDLHHLLDLVFVAFTEVMTESVQVLAPKSFPAAFQVLQENSLRSALSEGIAVRVRALLSLESHLRRICERLRSLHSVRVTAVGDCSLAALIPSSAASVEFVQRGG